jgi:hypothetical protein
MVCVVKVVCVIRVVSVEKRRRKVLLLLHFHFVL